MSEHSGDSTFEWLAVLSDPARARLLRLLEQAELSVGELCRIVRSPQSTVSRHLKALADGGWLGMRRDGTSRFYNLAFADRPDARLLLWQLVRATAEACDWVDDDERQLGAVLLERQSRSQAFFADAASRWGDVRSSLFGDLFQQQLLLSLLAPRQVVADLGCGTGELSALLAPFAGRIEAVDCSHAMIDAAKQRLQGARNVHLQVGDITRLALGSATVDIALMVLVMHTLKDPGLAIADAARTLKPGGRLIIVDLQPHDIAAFKTDMGHQWLGFESAQIARWFGAAALEGLRHSPLLPDPSAEGPPLFLAVGQRPPSTPEPPAAV